MLIFHTGLDVSTPSPLGHGQPTSSGEFFVMTPST